MKVSYVPANFDRLDTRLQGQILLPFRSFLLDLFFHPYFYETKRRRKLFACISVWIEGQQGIFFCLVVINSNLVRNWLKYNRIETVNYLRYSFDSPTLFYIFLKKVLQKKYGFNLFVKDTTFESQSLIDVLDFFNLFQLRI